MACYCPAYFLVKFVWTQVIRRYILCPWINHSLLVCYRTSVVTAVFIRLYCSVPVWQHGNKTQRTISCIMCTSFSFPSELMSSFRTVLLPSTKSTIFSRLSLVLSSLIVTLVFWQLNDGRRVFISCYLLCYLCAACFYLLTGWLSNCIPIILYVQCVYDSVQYTECMLVVYALCLPCVLCDPIYDDPVQCSVCVLVHDCHTDEVGVIFHISATPPLISVDCWFVVFV